MEESKPEAVDVRDVVREAIQEFVKAEQSKAEPAYKAELVEERKRREQLESRVNDLVEENKRSRQIAEEAEKSTAIRAELQRMGVSKIDLAYRVVKDDIQRDEEGRLLAKGDQGERPLKEYLTQFVNDNPELLPARITGGSGTGPAQKAPSSGGGLDLEKIRPGMSAEDLDRVRQEVARVANQTMKGQ